MTFDDILGLAMIAALFASMVWVSATGKGKRADVPDGDPDEPYKIYTSEFDVVISAEDISSRLPLLSLDKANGHVEFTDREWKSQLKQARQILATDAAEWAPTSHLSLTDTAILILVDQSGSMRGKRMAWLTASLGHLVENLVRAGSAVRVSGFTTAGWRGGFARKKWIADGRPFRPGRLCVLLHINYKDFDETVWHESDWSAMLQPDILRENVDGESLLWASQELEKRNESRKILLIVSDGAPVDDSTLTENGPSYMWWHWKKVVADLEANPEIELKAIGIDHQVNLVYASSTSVSVGEDFGAAVLQLLHDDDDSITG